MSQRQCRFKYEPLLYKRRQATAGQVKSRQVAMSPAMRRFAEKNPRYGYRTNLLLDGFDPETWHGDKRERARKVKLHRARVEGDTATVERMEQAEEARRRQERDEWEQEKRKQQVAQMQAKVVAAGEAMALYMETYLEPGEDGTTTLRVDLGGKHLDVVLACSESDPT